VGSIKMSSLLRKSFVVDTSSRRLGLVFVTQRKTSFVSGSTLVCLVAWLPFHLENDAAIPPLALTVVIPLHS